METKIIQVWKVIIIDAFYTNTVFTGNIWDLKMSETCERPNPIQFYSTDAAMPKGYVLHPAWGEITEASSNKGAFLPWPWGCILILSVLDGWIGLGPMFSMYITIGFSVYGLKYPTVLAQCCACTKAPLKDILCLCESKTSASYLVLGLVSSGIQAVAAYSIQATSLNC